MVEKNTDRLWLTVGAVIVGAIMIFMYRDEVGALSHNIFSSFNASVEDVFHEEITSSGDMDLSTITEDNPYGTMNFAIYGLDAENIQNHRLGTIGVAVPTGIITGDDLDNSGDSASGGAIKADDITENGYVINRTYDQDISEFMYTPGLVAKYGIAKIEIEGFGSLDVSDAEKMAPVNEILQNSGVRGMSYGVYIGYKGFGESNVTKDNPVTQHIFVTDTRGDVFTITVNVKVQ